jgi:cyclase
MLVSCNIPLIASGGAGSVNDFINVFKQTNVSGALAASIFHKNIIDIEQLKQNLRTELINIR